MESKKVIVCIARRWWDDRLHRDGRCDVTLYVFVRPPLHQCTALHVVSGDYGLRKGCFYEEFYAASKKPWEQTKTNMTVLHKIKMWLPFSSPLGNEYSISKPLLQCW